MPNTPLDRILNTFDTPHLIIVTNKNILYHLKRWWTGEDEKEIKQQIELDKKLLREKRKNEKVYVIPENMSQTSSSCELLSNSSLSNTNSQSLRQRSYREL